MDVQVTLSCHILLREEKEEEVLFLLLFLLHQIQLYNRGTVKQVYLVAYSGSG
jgi:hypothetical protein